MELRVFSRRWGHDDAYDIKKTEAGWEVSFGAYKGICSKNCESVLYDILKNDLISYPNDLGLYFERLWDEATEKNLTESQIQEKLNELAEWINSLEHRRPKWGGM